MENKQQNNSRRLLTAFIIMLLLINVVAGYLLYKQNSTNKNLETEKTEISNQYKAVSEDLENTRIDLESMKGRNATLDSTLTQRQEEIGKLQKDIERLIARGKLSGSELAKARQLIAQLQTENRNFLLRIDSLQRVADKLLSQNQELGQALDQEKATTAQLSQDKEQLSKKVELGSLLKTVNLSLSGIRTRGSGKEVVSTNIKKITALRVSFETGDNKVLEPGPVSLYVRIISPKGETISVKDQGSGTLQLAEGGSVSYTKKAEIDWNQSSKKVSVYWTYNFTEEGTYKAEVYQKGYLIGKAEVNLKSGVF